MYCTVTVLRDMNVPCTPAIPVLRDIGCTRTYPYERIQLILPYSGTWDVLYTIQYPYYGTLDVSVRA